MLSKNQIVDNKYEVLFNIHATTYGHSFRVKSIENGKLYMLKIYELDKLQPWHYNSDNQLIEESIHSKLDHPNISKFISCKKTFIDEKEVFIYVVDFISGETLQDKIEREGAISISLAKQIFSKILQSVKYLHESTVPILHCDITPLNIMLDMSKGELNPILFDFGLAVYSKHKSLSYNKSLPSAFYCAPELLKGMPCVESDIYSLGGLFYTMINGFFPFHENLGNFKINDSNFEDKIIDVKNNKLNFNNIQSIDSEIKLSITKSLLNDTSSRFNNIDDFIMSISRQKVIDVNDVKKSQLKQFKKKEGDGFEKIAGMESLKKMILEDVIEPLQDPDSFKDYGIEAPNAILFYGPPGCGKTFFAECLAEEIGFNFVKVGPGDMGSKYVHGGQEKIQELFREAKENSPTILFLDEIDAMIPDRENNDIGHHYSSEVNEWLVQLNNCGKEDIFIIAATNRMEKIDSAVLRSGRFDKKILIPVPDYESRKSLFNLYLSQRSKVVSDDIDCSILSQKTENFVCSDIKLIINDSARKARKSVSKIDQDLICQVIDLTSPSVSASEINKYSASKSDKKRNKIGF